MTKLAMAHWWPIRASLFHTKTDEIMLGRGTVDGRKGQRLYQMSQQDDLERSTIRRIFWRIVPFVVVAYFLGQLDRSNISIAAFQMNPDLKLTGAQYGFAAGLFFVPYCFLGIPSSIMLLRYGSRRWMAWIMVAWGVLAAAEAFVKGPYSLYVVRFLLGAAEAGLYPGVIFYLSLWFPARYRSSIYTIFVAAFPLAYLIGSPIAAGFLEIDGLLGLRGWQWLFLLEGAPTILFGFVFLRVMVDGPDQAWWLSPEQRDWLVKTLSHEEQHVQTTQPSSGWRSFFGSDVLILSLVFFGSTAATGALGLWLPLILKGFGVSNISAALLNTLPYVAALTVMLWWGTASDRSGGSNRVWRTVLPLLLIGVALAATVFAKSLVVSMVLLSLTLVGTNAMKGPFWALVRDWMPTARAATAIATINALGNLVGGIAAYVVGILKDQTGSFSLACLPLAGLAILSAVILLMMNQSRTKPVAV